MILSCLGDLTPELFQFILKQLNAPSTQPGRTMLSDSDILAAEQVMEADDISEVLNKAGQGLFKSVYYLPSNRAVVKVPSGKHERYSRSFYFEWAFYVAMSRAGMQQFFPDTVWGETSDGTPYIVQEMCVTQDESTLEGANRLARVLHHFGLRDLHCGNMGFCSSDSRPVCLDWGYDCVFGFADTVQSAIRSKAPTLPPVPDMNLTL